MVLGKGAGACTRLERKGALAVTSPQARGAARPFATAGQIKPSRRHPFVRTTPRPPCPKCGTAFELEAFRVDGTGDDREIFEGLLRCNGGGHRYPIVRGIPRLLPDAFETFRSEVQEPAEGGATPKAREFVRSAGVPTHS